MNKNKTRLVFALIAMVVIQVGLVFGQSAESISKAQVLSLAAESATSANNAIVGSWYLTVSSDTFPSSFKGMITFSKGGGLVASAQGDVLLAPPPGVPPVATAGHGAWVRMGNRKYLCTFRQIFYNGDGSYAGGAKIRNAVTLSQTGNSMSGQLIVQYYDSNDQVVFAGTGTFVGTRIVVEPLTP